MLHQFHSEIKQQLWQIVRLHHLAIHLARESETSPRIIGDSCTCFHPVDWPQDTLVWGTSSCATVEEKTIPGSGKHMSWHIGHFRPWWWGRRSRLQGTQSGEILQVQIFDQDMHDACAFRGGITSVLVARVSHVESSDVETSSLMSCKSLLAMLVRKSLILIDLVWFLYHTLGPNGGHEKIRYCWTWCIWSQGYWV